MTVSMDALAAMAAIEDEKEAAQEPGPVEIVPNSTPARRALKWGMDYLNPNKQATGGLIQQLMGTYEKQEADALKAKEELDAILSAQAKQDAYDAYSYVWSDKRFQSWVDKYGEDLMVDDFITDVSLPTQDDLISTVAHDVPGTGGTLQRTDMLNQRFAETNISLNEQKAMDKFSFYLDEDQFGVTYRDSPFSAHLNVRPMGQQDWGAQVGTQFGPPKDLKSPTGSANVGILGQGTSGAVSPYGNLNVSPVSGLNFNLYGQKYPGGYSVVNPSVSYQNQFNTPWGPLSYNIGRRGGRTTGGVQVRGDF